MPLSLTRKGPLGCCANLLEFSRKFFRSWGPFLILKMSTVTVKAPHFLENWTIAWICQNFLCQNPISTYFFLWFWERSSSSNFRWYPFFNFRHSRAENFNVKMYERNGEFPDSFSSSSIDMNCSWNMTRSVLILMLSHLDLILIKLTICCYKYLAATLCSNSFEL